jgi:Leu/Phe-tRNA-protein transferase
MEDVQLGIYPISYEQVTDISYLYRHIYPNMQKNYYWSEDFSPEFYIAQAKAGMIAVTDIFDGRELLLPEIQFSYAVLHFEDLHISRKVRKILRQNAPKLNITPHIDAVASQIMAYHKQCWLTPTYLQTLKRTQSLHENFQLISAYVEDEGRMIAGEIGYIIGNTYTSLSGFSSRGKAYRNYGTVQLVLLAQFLQEHGFAFWNLGQSYMPYKFHLGAKQYKRSHFLKLWYENI